MPQGVVSEYRLPESMMPPKDTVQKKEGALFSAPLYSTRFITRTGPGGKTT
jgi:hypothetical protein